MKISMIMARSLNDVIGKDGGLPWHIPSDLRKFRAMTMGNVVIMGRKTRESLPKDLDGRLTLVVSRSIRYTTYKGGREVWAPSPYKALEWLSCAYRNQGFYGLRNPDIYIAGGAEIYHELSKFSHYLYETRVPTMVVGDYLTKYRLGTNWGLVGSEDTVDLTTGINLKINTYENFNREEFYGLP